MESRILGALGAGADGGSYAIQREDGSRAELWHLAPGAITLASSRRLRLLRQLESPVLVRIHEARLEGDYPYVLAGDGTVEWAAPWPLDPTLARERLRALLSALAEAHRLGVVHGALAADCIGADARGRVCLDLTGLRVRGLATPPLAPALDAGAPSAATDVWSLGTIAVTALGAAMDGELGALLDEMRVDDPSLRPAAKEAAARLSPGGEAQPAERTQTTAPYLAGVPSRLGAYELMSVIGEGGMGRVYRARDTAGGPDVALKVLLPAWASDADVVRRFWREARVLAQLSSPYVTRFVAANEEAGFHYLVMEHVEAQSAAALLRDRGRLDADLALSIACDAARALAEVHAIGLVHRDVKPGNILVELVEGARPRVKLCDFGIARSTAGDRTDLTNAGTPGTPAYMSPEQIRGEELDARSDVYSLGATLYALLAGRPPFEGAGLHDARARHGRRGAAEPVRAHDPEGDRRGGDALPREGPERSPSRRGGPRRRAADRLARRGRGGHRDPPGHRHPGRAARLRLPLGARGRAGRALAARVEHGALQPGRGARRGRVDARRGRGLRARRGAVPRGRDDAALEGEPVRVDRAAPARRRARVRRGAVRVAAQLGGARAARRRRHDAPPPRRDPAAGDPRARGRRPPRSACASGAASSVSISASIRRASRRAASRAPRCPTRSSRRSARPRSSPRERARRSRGRSRAAPIRSWPRRSASCCAPRRCPSSRASGRVSSRRSAASPRRSPSRRACSPPPRARSSCSGTSSAPRAASRAASRSRCARSRRTAAARSAISTSSSISRAPSR
ncbi:MAG: serine/threonine-protein kinase [Sandaracinaceae bacterium]|nr:serine/threonine-protein kinase [Sandaracinaceae bacterium]